jgi:paraquat-inducible protein B
MANNLSGTLAAARSLFATLTPEAQATLKGVRQSLDQLDHTLLTETAPVQQNLAGTLDEIRRAARSMRVMADYLQNHPDSLLRGHGTDPAVSALQPTAAK